MISIMIPQCSYISSRIFHDVFSNMFSLIDVVSLILIVSRGKHADVLSETSNTTRAPSEKAINRNTREEHE